jgi:hypothetical protein
VSATMQEGQEEGEKERRKVERGGKEIRFVVVSVGAIFAGVGRPDKENANA